MPDRKSDLCMSDKRALYICPGGTIDSGVTAYMQSSRKPYQTVDVPGFANKRIEKNRLALS